MSVKPIPDGYHTITSYLVSEDADTLIHFLQKAFAATVIESISGPDGHTAHAELKIGTSNLMVGGKKGAPATQAMLYLYVENADAMYQQALAAGAISLMEPRDMFYGDRNAAVEDPSGNKWWIATHIEDVSKEELTKRAKAQYAQEAK